MSCSKGQGYDIRKHPRYVAIVTRTKLGQAVYGLAAVALRAQTAVASRLPHRRRSDRDLETADQVAVTFQIQRVRDLSFFRRTRTRLWLAATHGWATRYAGFDWYLTARAGSKVVSIAGVVERDGAVGGQAARLGLLGGVLTLPAFRGRGLGSEVVGRATQLIEDELGCDFGVLMCGDELVGFYERLGWKHAPNAVEYERFGATRLVEINTMVYECGNRSLPPGTIELSGLPA
jgi:GNAT superfamily N-acetyltransferase